MSEKIAKININFEVIESNSPKSLIIGDFSEWSQLYQKPAIINITLPGSKKPASHNFIKESLNSFNSVTLGLSPLKECEETYTDLSDGIYFIELLPSPSTYKFSRYYLKTDKLRLELDKVYVKSGFEYDPKNRQFRDDMLDIEFLLTTAKAATRLGEIPRAKRDYDEALKIFDKYNECKNWF